MDILMQSVSKISAKYTISNNNIATSCRAFLLAVYLLQEDLVHFGAHILLSTEQENNALWIWH